MSAVGFGVERKRGQGIKSAGDVEQAGIGVDVGRQARVGMPHGLLGGPKRDAPFAQESAKGRAEGMHVERPAPIVTFGNTGGFEVAIQDADQTRRHVEQRRGRGKLRRDRLAKAEGVGSKRIEFVGEPVAEVVRQVSPNGDGVPFAVLLIGRVEFDIGQRAIEPELGDGEARQLPFAESGQDERLVDQGSLSTKSFEAGSHARTDIGGNLPLPLAPANGHGVEQGAMASHIEQPPKFLLSEGTTAPAGVGRLIGLRDRSEGIGSKSAGSDTPVTERHHRGLVGVSTSGGSAIGDFVGEPAFQGFPPKVAEPGEPAIVGEPKQIAPGIVAVALRDAPTGHRLDEPGDMFSDRGCQVRGGPSFGR